MLHRRMLRRPPLLLLLQLLLLLLAGVRPVGRRSQSVGNVGMHYACSGQWSGIKQARSVVLSLWSRCVKFTRPAGASFFIIANRRAVPPPRYRVTACWPHFTIQIARKMVDLKRYGNWRKGFLVVSVPLSCSSSCLFCISCICVFYR